MEAVIIEEKPAFARGRVERVVQRSAARIEPPCQYFGRCGGCHYQHIGYHDQLAFKAEILKETLRRVAKVDLPIEIETHASPPLNYRNRTRFHLRSLPEFAIGYFRHGSRELLPVRECPISSPLINRALSALWKAGEALQVPAEVNEVELFANHGDDRLLAELYVRDFHAKDTLCKLAGIMAELMPEATGIVAFQSAAGKPYRAQPPELLWGESTFSYMVNHQSYRVSAGAFFQTNRHLVGRMIDLAIAGRHGKLALDLYAGVGLFTLPLARRFKRVIAVESSSVSAEDLRASAPGNVKVSSQSTRTYLASAAGSLRPDLIVVDPPRTGLGNPVCQEISRLAASEIVYVSCDPATLGRDLKQLTKSGFKIVELHLIDLFPQTFHIETCAILRRQVS